MLTLHLDCHDYISAIEGFARGSHLRQHIWEMVVHHHIKQMSDMERDTIWFFFRRDIWPVYFDSQFPNCGDMDFLQCMAAMHRTNYRLVTFRKDGKGNGKHIQSYCYCFQNEWRPENSMRSFIPKEWIVSVTDPFDMAHTQPLYIEQGKEMWWTNLGVYNLDTETIRRQTIMESDSRTKSSSFHTHE